MVFIIDEQKTLEYLKTGEAFLGFLLLSTAYAEQRQAHAAAPRANGPAGSKGAANCVAGT